MSKKNSYSSTQNYYNNNNSSFSQNILSYIILEKEILKLINYLRINPIQYLSEYNNYFENDDIDIIVKEISNLEIKLFELNTKKEISQAGKDYLDFLRENTNDYSYFNFDKGDKTCFNLRARLANYGQRFGKIFESVIINSSCAEEIVNKLLKDEKARNMILSPKMKYIGITSGYLPKINNICTIIDIVQDFKSYKDIDIINNNNININNITNTNNSTIQIINTIDFDENENNSESKDQKQSSITYKIKDNKFRKTNNNYGSKTTNNNKLSMAKKTSRNYDDKNNKLNENSENKTIIERKSNNNILVSRNNGDIFNNTSKGKSIFIAPLATYKSDAHLIYNQTHSNFQNSFSSLKRVNSDINNSNDWDVNNNKSVITMAGNNYRNPQELYDKYDNKKNTSSNKLNSNNKKIFANVKEKKEQSKNKENEIKIKLIKKEDKKIENEKKTINDEEKLRISNFSLKNIDFNKIGLNENKDISKIETKNNETIMDVKNNTGNEISNYNISFDNNAYSFFSKDNQNTDNTINENDNNNSNLLLNAEQNKKHNSFFSQDKKINNLKLFKKEKINNQIYKKKNEKNNKLTDVMEQKSKEKKDSNLFSKKNENNEKNLIFNENEKKNFEIDDNEENYCLKDKKEIKQLIRLYNKERQERRAKSNMGLENLNIKEHNINNNNNNNINNENNNSENNDGNNKKSTATFFYIQKNKKEANKNQIYHKRKVNTSNSNKKGIKNNCRVSNSPFKNIITKRLYITKNIFTESNDYNRINNNNNFIQNRNMLLTDSNYSNNNSNYNTRCVNYNDKKRISSYKTNRSKLFKNKSLGNYNTDSLYNNLEEKQYLSDKNISDIDDNMSKSPKYQFKRISNGNTETNVNSDNNNDYTDEMLKFNVYKNNKKELKEIDINYIYFNKNNYNIFNGNYIYKKNKVIPEKKNNFVYLNRNINENKGHLYEKYNATKTSNINKNRRKKFIIPDMNSANYFNINV